VAMPTEAASSPAFACLGWARYPIVGRPENRDSLGTDK
jgi:hypothetical protein